MTEKTITYLGVRCTCTPELIRLGRAARRSYRRVTGEDRTQVVAHADHCLLGGVHGTPGWSVAGVARRK